jgi:hypothetical protein
VNITDEQLEAVAAGKDQWSQDYEGSYHSEVFGDYCGCPDYYLEEMAIEILALRRVIETLRQERRIMPIDPAHTGPRPAGDLEVVGEALDAPLPPNLETDPRRP